MSENKKKINIVFDIGVASVGWSLIDEDHNIIDMGVRLFNDVADNKDGSLKNQKRRSMRGLRRRIRRTRNRKDAYLNFLVANNWVNSIDDAKALINIDITKFGFNNPIELKYHALSNKVSKEALIYILFHYLHHRGFFYVTEEQLDKEQTMNEQNVYPTEEIYNFYINKIITTRIQKKLINILLVNMKTKFNICLNNKMLMTISSRAI